jgi:hypothetical protein
VRLLISPILILGLAITGDGPQDSGRKAARLVEMRVIADGVTVEKADRDSRLKVERLPEPVYRFDDPARQYSDGTVWVWGQSGRPAALLTLSEDRASAEGHRWIAEMTSLAPGPISATVPEIGAWQPSGAGIVMQKFPKAPLPAEDATKRLRQMKELHRQIKAFEYFRPGKQMKIFEYFKPGNQIKRERYELRTLPQPVHRYADARSGLIDGGMFIISYGLNPELVLLLETRREGSSAPEWYYGLARISIAELHLVFENKEIWSHPGGYSKGPDDIYWTFAKPIKGE